MRTSTRTLMAATAVATLALAAAPVPTEQDDAGTGADAGDEIESAVAVDLATAYDATLLPSGLGATSDYDWFTFTAAAGEFVQADILDTGPVPFGAFCLTVRDGDGAVLAESACADAISFTAPADGTYVLEVGYFVAVPADYTFRITAS